MDNKNLIDCSPFLHRVYHESFLSGPLHKMKEFGVWSIYKTRAAIEYLNTIPRAFGFKDSRFMPLKAYGNRFKGKRVFITCTGPSLTIEDLEMLEDEYVFGMNSICLIHDKTAWKPDFYGIQDVAVFEKLKEAILSTDNGVVFAPYGYKKSFGTPENWVYWPMCGSYHLFELIYGPKYYTKFHFDSYVRLYDGYSITYSILQLVMYMGFEEIYLLGADCNYLGKQQHFIEHGNYEKPERAADAGDRLSVSYMAAKKYADSHGIKIYNATRGGCLELFPRVNLDEIIARSEKNKVAE